MSNRLLKCQSHLISTVSGNSLCIPTNEFPRISPAKYAGSVATCNDDELASGGGFYTNGDISDSERFSANGWHVTAHSASDFTVEGNVQCIKIEVGIKPTEPPQAPGGSPPFMRGSEPTPPGLILPP